jgi:uncharacterized membrane protein
MGAAASAVGAAATAVHGPVPVVGVAAAVLVLTVLAARGIRCAVRRARLPRWAAGLGLSVCLLAALPGVAAAGAPALDAVGPEGRAFLLHHDTAAVRVYAGLGTGRTPAERVDAAVAALDRADGFARSTLLVVVPTGSGWVNRAAVEALEDLIRGDVATVVVQYAQRPSWQEYALGAAATEESARVLVGALRARVDALPAGERPRLLVYGESLGALGARAAAADADGVLVAGTPAAAWDRDAVAGVASVLHPDDPVGWFSPRLLLERPDAWPGPWLPVVSFWTTAGSLLSALDAPPGHGHRYGPELAEAWRGVADIPGGQPFTAPDARPAT